MQTTYDHADVEIRDMPSTPVAMIEHRGDRTTLNETIQRFIAWRKAAGLSPENSTTITVFRSEREPADPADYAMDLCVATAQAVAADGIVMPGMIPAGRCAVLRAVNGASNNFEPEALFLYRDWLPASGEETRDFPIYCMRRLQFFPEREVYEAVAELCLPLK